MSRGRNRRLEAARAAHAEALVHPQGTPQRTAFELHAAAEAVEDEGGETGLSLPTSASYAQRGDDGPMGVEAWARQALQPSDRVPAYVRHHRLYVRLGCDVHGCTSPARVLVVLPRGAEGFRCVAHLRAIYADLPAGALTVGLATTHSSGDVYDTREEREMDRMSDAMAYETLAAGGVL